MPMRASPLHHPDHLFRRIGSALEGAGLWLRQLLDECFDLIEELITNRFFRSLGDVDWSAYQLGPLVVSSLLINLLELASPLYINIVYTSVLPTGSMASLLVLSSGVVVLMLLGGWLKTVRLGLTGADGARLEHRNRLEALDHFCRMPLDTYLELSPAAHAERLSSINMLRDETTVQALTTAIDLAFSLLFVVVLFVIGGSVGFIAVVAIVVYLLRALAFSRDYETIAKQRDELELSRLTYQNQLVGAIDLIKANGLGRQYLVGHELRQEELAHQRMENAQFSGRYQAFGVLTSQVAMAAMVTWGAFLVITDQLLVGALAACLLLAGKVLSPWQQAMALWNSYRRLSHAREEYDGLMAQPVEPEGGHERFRLSPGSELRVALPHTALPPLPAGSVMVLRDGRFGADVRNLFLALLQLESQPGLTLNGVPIECFNRKSLRHGIAYVDPSQAFFEGTLLQNLTSFQPRRYQRRALFWSFLSGLDAKVRALPLGYNTPMGAVASPGLSSDLLKLAQLVRALAPSPQLLLVDLNGCSYGKDFIEGMQRILQRTRGHTSVWISGGGRVLDGLSDQQLALPPMALEVTR
jgi:ABC-type bacteriocin/lantibiotic exporter with double-glycine peptidase domain